jgi:hypothetical protein
MHPRFSKDAALRILADSLTGLRLVLAALIVGLGFTRGKDALETVIGALLVGWTADTLDGHVARRSRDTRKTWLSQNDIPVDAAMAVSSLIYLTMAGFVSVAVCLAYLVVASLLVAVFRARTLIIALEVPLALLPVVIGFARRPVLGWAFVGWAALAVLLDHHRFFVRVRMFFDGVPDILHRARSATGESSESDQ